MLTDDLVKACNRAARDVAERLSTKPVAVGTVVILNRKGKLVLRCHASSVLVGAGCCCDAVEVFLDAGKLAFERFFDGTEVPCSEDGQGRYRAVYNQERDCWDLMFRDVLCASFYVGRYPCAEDMVVKEVARLNADDGKEDEERPQGVVKNEPAAHGEEPAEPVVKNAPGAWRKEGEQ